MKLTDIVLVFFTSNGPQVSDTIFQTKAQCELFAQSLSFEIEKHGLSKEVKHSCMSPYPEGIFHKLVLNELDSKKCYLTVKNSWDPEANVIFVNSMPVSSLADGFNLCTLRKNTTTIITSAKDGLE